MAASLAISAIDERILKARLYARLGLVTDLADLLCLPLYPSQLQVAEDYAAGKAKRFVLDWGRQAGKTILAAFLACYEMLRHDAAVWILGPEYAETDAVWTYLDPMLLDEGPIHPTLPDSQGLGIIPVSYRKGTPKYLELPWGSIVETRPTNSVAVGTRRGRAQRGRVLDLIVWDECAFSYESAWHRMQPMLAVKDGSAFFISTPNGDNHFREWWEQGLPTGFTIDGEHMRYVKTPDRPQKQDGWLSYYATSEQNFPNHPGLQQAYLEAMQTWSPERFRQEYHGSFEAFVGQVYKEFDMTVHVAEETIEYDPSLPLYLTFDFGTTNPFVCLWIQTTLDDRVLIIDEYYKTGLETVSNGEAVLDQHARGGGAVEVAPGGYGEPEWFSADPAGRDAIMTLQKQCGIRAHYREMSRERKEVAWGIETWRRILKRRPQGGLERGSGALVVNPHCENTIHEFNSYRYRESSDDRNAPEEVEKANDHCMDAARYWLSCWYARGAEGREIARRYEDKPKKFPSALDRIAGKHDRMWAGLR